MVHSSAGSASVRARGALIGGPSGLLVLAAVGFSLGCGSEDRVVESTARYLPPAEYRMAVEAVVELPFGTSWDGLVSRLSDSPFRVLTLDKASRFLVVELDRSTDASRAANPPGRFVDCGRMQRTLTEDGRTREFAYALADSSRHDEAYAVGEGYEIRDVSRAVDLGARATVYLRPDGETRTRVTVNSRYTLTIETTGTTRRVPRRAADPEGKPRVLEPSRVEVRFMTFTQSGLVEGGKGIDQGRKGIDGDRICRATGELERALLALAQPATAG